MNDLFLTGGTGFIGKHIIELYSQEFDRIFVPTRRSEYVWHAQNVNVITVDGSIEAVISAYQDNPCNTVINCAAYGVSPDERDVNKLELVNVELPFRLAKAMRKSGPGRFIQIGSMAEYSAPHEHRPLQEDADIQTTDGYGGAKARASCALLSLPMSDLHEVLILRAFGVFGPGEANHRLIPSLIEKLSKGQPVSMSSGTQVRDFIFVNDLASALLRACLAEKTNPAPRIYNVGSGTGISVAAFARKVCEIGKYDPALLRLGELPLRDTDVPYMVADISAIKSDLGWYPQYSIDRAISTYLQAIQISL